MWESNIKNPWPCSENTPNETILEQLTSLRWAVTLEEADKTAGDPRGPSRLVERNEHILKEIVPWEAVSDVNERGPWEWVVLPRIEAPQYKQSNSNPVAQQDLQQLAEQFNTPSSLVFEPSYRMEKKGPRTGLQSPRRCRTQSRNRARWYETPTWYSNTSTRGPSVPRRNSSTIELRSNSQR